MKRRGDVHGGRPFGARRRQAQPEIGRSDSRREFVPRDPWRSNQQRWCMPRWQAVESGTTRGGSVRRRAPADFPPCGAGRCRGHCRGDRSSRLQTPSCGSRSSGYFQKLLMRLARTTARSGTLARSHLGSPTRDSQWAHHARFICCPRSMSAATGQNFSRHSRTQRTEAPICFWPPRWRLRACPPRPKL